jgi:hypothetical protein
MFLTNLTNNNSKYPWKLGPGAGKDGGRALLDHRSATSLATPLINLADHNTSHMPMQEHDTGVLAANSSVSVGTRPTYKEQ